MMDKRTTDIVAYLTWVGLLIAFIMGDRENCKFHLNQSLVIWLTGTVLGWIPIVRVVAGIFCAVCVFIGIVNAYQGQEREVPLIGQIHLLR